MLAKRIIPCLDVKDGRTVKGINFLGLKDVGDPVELGAAYAAQGADELVYLDISATVEGRGTFVSLVEKIASRVNIPFTVGGGISSLDDAARLLDSGADKISVNSAAVRNPDLIDRIAGIAVRIGIWYGKRCSCVSSVITSGNALSPCNTYCLVVVQQGQFPLLCSACINM